MLACFPRKFFVIRCPEIASEAILEQKQNHSSYMARGALNPIFGCPCTYALAIPADFQFPQEKVLKLTLRTAGGVTSLEGQPLNSREPEIGSDIFMRASFHRHSC